MRTRAHTERVPGGFVQGLVGPLSTCLPSLSHPRKEAHVDGHKAGRSQSRGLARGPWSSGPMRITPAPPVTTDVTPWRPTRRPAVSVCFQLYKTLHVSLRDLFCFSQELSDGVVGGDPRPGTGVSVPLGPHQLLQACGQPPCPETAPGLRKAFICTLNVRSSLDPRGIPRSTWKGCWSCRTSGQLPSPPLLRMCPTAGVTEDVRKFLGVRHLI